MKIINSIKEVLKKSLNIAEPIYLSKGASIICKDKEGAVNKKVEIIPTHIDLDADIPTEFPRFEIVKTSSRDGMIGMYRKHVMNLDTDDMPTEGSKNLLTSDTLYQIISELTQRIKELESKIKK